MTSPHVANCCFSVFYQPPHHTPSSQLSLMKEHFCSNINKDLIYKLTSNLKIFKSSELELIFIEIINPKHKNVIVGFI